MNGIPRSVLFVTIGVVIGLQIGEVVTSFRINALEKRVAKIESTMRVKDAK